MNCCGTARVHFQLVQLITFYPKVLKLSPSLRPLCPTQCTVCRSAINSTLNTWRHPARPQWIHCTRQRLVDTHESFDTFSVKLAHLVFSAAEHFSTNLQDTTLAEWTRGALHFIVNCSSIHYFLPGSSSSLTDGPALPHPQRVPKRFTEGAQPHHYTSPEEKYCQAYFEQCSRRAPTPHTHTLSHTNVHIHNTYLYSRS